MGANIAGIYGAQIFRSDDRPKYRRGFTTNCAILTTALILAITRLVDDLIRKRKRKALGLSDANNNNNESGSEENSDEKKAIDAEKQPVDVKTPL